ncbi:MAG: cobalt-precorrin-5B (C(1))-methyltransferase CbiD [Cyanobacteriota bacterium]|nr:cobalt-precorrin-5B (C(1))-methyltransferase CbiD [Cyanobacteriota bacterium]
MSTLPSSTPRPVPPARGYTLPVWVAAAARAALTQLRGEPFQAEQLLQLTPSAPDQLPQAVPVLAAAPLGEGRALAVARCDPGDGLDLTRGLMVWVEASWHHLDPSAADDWLLVQAGEGVGIHAESRDLCISGFARELLACNLQPLVPKGRGLHLQVIFPNGRQLAERTSNAAFGVVDGLALIGTQAETQASADPDQLGRTLAALRQRLSDPGFSGDLVLVIGENGLDLAPRLGLPPQLLLKCGNWLGPVLVAAGQGGVRRLLLFGYQGKLIKLAGGIFHTHHHLADGRLDILTAHAALEGLSGEALGALHAAATVEAGLAELQRHDAGLADRVRRRLADAIEARSLDYLNRHDATGPAAGAVLFDRSRRISACGAVGKALLRELTQAETGELPTPRVQRDC